MSEIVKQETLDIVTPSNVWVVGIPAGGRMARPLAAYDVDGNSLQWDSWEFLDGNLSVNFGIDTHDGKLRYEYITDVAADGDGTTVMGEGGQIHVTVHQYNGGGSSQS